MAFISRGRQAKPHGLSFTAHVNAERARFRDEYGKGSALELLAKEAGNSLYGKTAQGVAAMRPVGINDLSAKTAFNTRNGSTEHIPPSAITQPAVAAMTTGLLRAVLSEGLANLPDVVAVMSATTDGWLSTATPEQAAAATSSPVCRYFASLRAMVNPDGSATIIEQKHDATQVLSMKTRGSLRDRVLESVRGLSYVPSRAARSLRSGKSQLIGLAVADLANPFYSRIVWAAEKAVAAWGFSLVVLNSDEKPENENQILDLTGDCPSTLLAYARRNSVVILVMGG